VVSVYVASPLGFSSATRSFYEEEVLAALRGAGFSPIDPWEEPAFDAAFARASALPPGEERLAAFAELNGLLGARNAAKIDEAGAMLAILDGVDVDSGTAAEIGYAAARGKPVVGVRLDTRQAGDNEGACVNLQVEHFIRSGGGELVRSLADAIAVLGRIAPGAAGASPA
jgi:nucleoside 2-deoxyribosyltransferase